MMFDDAKIKKVGVILGLTVLFVKGFGRECLHINQKRGGNHANDESLYANIIIFSIFAFVTMRTFNHKRKIIL